MHIEQHQRGTGHSGITAVEDLDTYRCLQLPQSEKDVSAQEKGLLKTDEASATEANSKENEANPDGKITCDLCSKKFSSKQNYEVHLKAVHENQKPYHCDKCNKSFPYLNSLKCHKLQHTEKSDKSYLDSKM